MINQSKPKSLQLGLNIAVSYASLSLPKLVEVKFSADKACLTAHSACLGNT